MGAPPRAENETKEPNTKRRQELRQKLYIEVVPVEQPANPERDRASAKAKPKQEQILTTFRNANRDNRFAADRLAKKQSSGYYTRQQPAVPKYEPPRSWEEATTTSSCSALLTSLAFPSERLKKRTGPRNRGTDLSRAFATSKPKKSVSDH